MGGGGLVGGSTITDPQGLVLTLLFMFDPKLDNFLFTKVIVLGMG